MPTLVNRELVPEPLIHMEFERLLFHPDFAKIGNELEKRRPSHAIAFRTVDITDPTFVAAPFAGKLRYDGGKLGYNDYMNTGTVYGINVQDELYNLTTSSGTPNAQVAAAIQVAFANYITFLKCTGGGELTGTDGTPCTQTPACGYYQG